MRALLPQTGANEKRESISDKKPICSPFLFTVLLLGEVL